MTEYVEWIDSIGHQKFYWDITLKAENIEDVQANCGKANFKFKKWNKKGELSPKNEDISLFIAISVLFILSISTQSLKIK